LHRRKRPVGMIWRMDETYIRVKGHSYYLSRAVDKDGQTIDFLLTVQRDKDAALLTGLTCPKSSTHKNLPQNRRWCYPR
jgi:transposase-like protein